MLQLLVAHITSSLESLPLAVGKEVPTEGERCDFHPGRGTVDQILTELLKGLEEFDLMFCEIGEGFNLQPPSGDPVRVSLLQAIRSLYDQNKCLHIWHKVELAYGVCWTLAGLQ